MLYKTEFERLKKIYDRMDAAKREMIGPMVLMPFAAMAVFGLVLVPFGVIRLVHVPFIGLLAGAVSALMIVKVMDIGEELREWREGTAPAGDTGITEEVALRMAAAANDPGRDGQAQNSAETPPENRAAGDNAG